MTRVTGISSDDQMVHIRLDTDGDFILWYDSVGDETFIAPDAAKILAETLLKALEVLGTETA